MSHNKSTLKGGWYCSKKRELRRMIPSNKKFIAGIRKIIYNKNNIIRGDEVMKNEILRLLENNSRLTADDIAIMIGKDVATVRAAITELENAQVICGYNTLINWDHTDRHDVVTALIEVRVTPQRGEGFDKVAERIYQYNEVKSVYLMSGGFDFTVIIEGKTMKEVALFVGQKLAPLESVLSTATHFVLKKYKDYGVIFEEEKKDGRMIVSP